LIAHVDNEVVTRIYNLHIHSKIHQWLLNSREGVASITTIANGQDLVSIPGTRRVQVLDFISRGIHYGAKDPARASAALRAALNQRRGKRPSSYPFISGDSFRSICNHVWEEGSRVLKPYDIREGDLIFCQSDLLEEFESRILTEIDSSVTLVLGNSDRNFSSELALFRQRYPGLTLFAQNLDQSVVGTSPLPIGLENAWRAHHGIPRFFNVTRKQDHEKLIRIMWSFSSHTNPKERALAATWLAKCDLADKVEHLSARKHRKALSSYAFVAAPQGHGIDTHRTWEAMYVGSIPIVQRSFMTEEYEKLGLPLWVIDSYEDLLDVDEMQLQRKYHELKPKFDARELWADFWFDRLKGLHP
jgi:hypothetical protein